MRKLVTIRKISDLTPIEGADAIETATIDGWKVVVKKGDFEIGEHCVYFEIDSFLPDGNVAWQFLVDKSPSTQDGKLGHRLRTVRLRGQVSQGLVLNFDAFDLATEPKILEAIDLGQTDFSQLLGVVKWDPPIPAELQGQVEGLMPSNIRKTDQERCQNVVAEFFSNPEARYEVSIKLDGTSVTYYCDDGKIGVCGRNYEFKINAENQNNTMIRIMRESKLDEVLKHFQSLGINYAIQGELMGPGIQKNRENLKHHVFYIFDIQNLTTGEYLTADERDQATSKIVNTMISNTTGDRIISAVPILAYDTTLAELGITNIDELLNFAEGPSLNNPVREGLVFKRMDGKFSFKAISNKFLLKGGD